jgi:hypothetical protein
MATDKYRLSAHISQTEIDAVGDVDERFMLRVFAENESMSRSEAIDKYFEKHPGSDDEDAYGEIMMLFYYFEKLVKDGRISRVECETTD